MSISRLYEISRRSLAAYQRALNTTADNISNVNNPNYSRRLANLRNITSDLSGLGQIGAGVSAEDIQRLRHRFAETQLWSANQDLGKYESAEMLLTQVEGIFAEDSDSGLSDILAEFWNAWSNLANEPESQFARTIVRDKAVLLANTFNRIDSDFQRLRDQITPEIEGNVQTVNQKLKQLAEINQQLRLNQAPELLDERDKILNELSKTMNITVREDEFGGVTLLTGGLVLVSDTTVNELEMQTNRETNPPQIKVTIRNMPGEAKFTSGQLSSLLNMYNKGIPEYMAKVDQLARSIAAGINEIHQSGYNVSGITGLSFFEEEVDGAADLRVNDAILQDPALIATRTASEGPGSGSVAQSIADLQYRKSIGDLNFADYFSSMMSELGNTIQETSFKYSSQQLIVQQIENQRDAVTGVSLDEEMTRLVQYEQAYEAATRVLSTVDEMMNTLLELR